MSIDYTYIESAADLEAAISRLRQCDAVALDTEFSRSHTYYPDIGLVQLYDGQDCYLVDPLEINDLAPLAALLEDDSVTKVVHACSEDLEVLQYAAGTTPTPVFDTQIASAALGLSFAVSYQNLVEHFLGIAIDKEETRSDWLQRPLSQSQLDYAALDVIHLLEVYHKQVDELDSAGKSHWVAEECASLGDEVAITLSPESVYRKVKSIGRMTPAELNRLQALCAWREKLARKLNLPRNRVLDEKALVSIVRGDIRDKSRLQNKAGMTPRQVRKFGDDILFLLSEARLVPEQDFPPAEPDISTPINGAHLKLLKRVVQDRAESLKVAPELLAKRRHLEQLVRSEELTGEFCLPEPLLGWREDAIGRFLLEALQQSR